MKSAKSPAHAAATVVTFSAGLLVVVVAMTVLRGRSSPLDPQPRPVSYTGGVEERLVAPGGHGGDASRLEATPVALSTQRLLVRVQDEAGLPVRDAKVLVAGDSSASEHYTDARGEAEFVLGEELQTGAHVLAAHPNYRVCKEPVPPPMDGGVKVVLSLNPAGVITGRVVTRSGEGVAQAQVVCWPADLTSPPRDLVQRVQAYDPMLSKCQADESGFFELGSLNPGREYSLCAASSSSVSGLIVKAGPGDTDVTIQVDKLYGVNVVLVERGRSDLRVPAGSFNSARAPQAVDPSVHYASVPAFAPHLFGVKGTQERRGLGGRAFFYTSSLDVERAGPIQYTVDVFGYVPEQFEFYATPVEEGIEDVVLELTPSEPERGNLELRVFGAPEPDVSTGSWRSGGARVTLETATGRRCSFIVDNISDPVHIIEDIPYGRYEFSLRVPPSTFQFPGGSQPPLVVDISESMAVVEVDLSAAGALYPRFYLPTGEEYLGPVTCIVVRGDTTVPGSSGPGEPIVFDSGPVLMPAMPIGKCTVFVAFPSVAEPLKRAQVVDIEPGQTASPRFAVASL